MTGPEDRTPGYEKGLTPRGRTRWWVFSLIMGLPALAVAGFLTLIAIWVLTN